MLPYYRQLIVVIAIIAVIPVQTVLGQNSISIIPDTGKSKSDAVRAVRAEVGDKAFAELLIRLHKTNSDIKLKGIKTIDGKPNAGGSFLTGYPYTEFYDWDLYFENLYLGYYGVSKYCYTNLKEFLSRQEADGYINRSLHKQRDRQHFKPFLAQLVVLGGRQDKNNYEWLKTSPESPKVPDNGTYYNRLKMYIDKWFSYDGDRNGLPTWNSADAAGTDNQWSRAGQLGAFEVEGVDLATYLARELQAMEVIAQHLGETEDQQKFLDHAEKLNQLINEVFWDEKQGLYFDRNEKLNAQIPVKSATNFLPMFCGAPSESQVKRMVKEHLTNPDEFWLAYPVATYSKTEPDYYQGSVRLPNGSMECNWRGSTWAPTNYMIFQGLMHYGQVAVARELADRLFEMAVVKNPVLREYYNAETGDGLGQTNFWGFTALYYVMPLECELGYDISALEGPFRPIIPEELDVQY
jgi:Mannosylglycerate hydrolase MGH1-like glycoside hydrolase domain